MPQFKLVFFAPIASTQAILRHIFSSSPDAVGKIGHYKSCAFISRGTGQFLPQEGASPSIGQVGKPEFVDEDKVEVIVNDNEGKFEIKKVIEQLKMAHPYEQVAYEVYRVEDI